MEKIKYILGIETSCDDTGVAICKIEGKKITLIDAMLSSQIDIHKEYGGVVPEVASRLHLENLPILFKEILNRNNITKEMLDAIGVTQGPGLKGSLLMGMNYSKGLSFALNKPLIGVNHIKAHIMAALLDNQELSFPFLAVVVSGGHTEIISANSLSDMKVLTKTIDDAAGEAFDKSASLLGFDYPGGASLSRLADTVSDAYKGTVSSNNLKEIKSKFALPKVMREAKGFSFSGLKTAISLLLKKYQDELQDENIKACLCYAIQDAIVDAIIYKTKKILKTPSYKNYKNVVLAGGVAANKCLRKRFENLQGVNLYLPDFKHCQDNGAMVAYLASKMYLENDFISLDAKVYPRWEL
jgi:N6-L-threonylcarbamoyladenine synthase